MRITTTTTQQHHDTVPARPDAWTWVSVAGALVFLLGTVLHPARDGRGIAEVGGFYGITHAVQATGLLLLAVALTGLLLRHRGSTRQLDTGIVLALIGTLTWLELIVYDGAHNPVAARYAPDLVHTPQDLDLGGAVLVVPALILFPFGYLVLAVALIRRSARLAGGLLAAGAVLYTTGGLFIFIDGPHSPLVQPLEVIGAVAYAAGIISFGPLQRLTTAGPAVP